MFIFMYGMSVCNERACVYVYVSVLCWWKMQ